MKHSYKKIISLTVVVISTLFFMSYSTGPANGGLSVTGAPFGTFGSGVYCNNCHGGGPFTPTIQLQLLSNGVAVPNNSNYVPGWNYTIRITRNADAAYFDDNLYPDAGWGFQITSVRNANNADINTWGASLPANTANRFIAPSHHYIEHTQKLDKNLLTIDIPWTAPTGNLGTVKFYLALNTVNGDGASGGGDNPLATTATFTQAPLSVSWLYFRGKEIDKNNLIEWATSNETDNNYFTLERSEDGIHFTELTQVKASKEPVAIHVYSYEDKNSLPKTFYRIKQTDINGTENYFRTIQLSKNGLLNAMHYIQGNEVIFKMESAISKEISVTIYSLDGKKMTSKKLLVYEGSNTIQLTKPEVNGMYFIAVTDKNETVYTGKFITD